MNEQIVMQEAIQLKRAGRFDEARRLYHEVINAIPHCDPAYKGLAKVEIGSGHFEQAIQALLMKIDLGIFFTYQQCSPDQRMFMLANAMGNLFDVTSGSDVVIAEKRYTAGTVEIMCRNDPVARDIALLAWAEVDLFFYLGHCMVRLFPSAFVNYRGMDEMMSNLERALLGCQSGSDARDSEYAPMFYVSGFLLACANLQSVIPSVDSSLLRQRFCRKLDFLGLG